MTALSNLGAQLTARYGLSDDFAPATSDRDAGSCRPLRLRPEVLREGLVTLWYQEDYRDDTVVICRVQHLGPDAGPGEE